MLRLLQNPLVQPLGLVAAIAAGVFLVGAAAAQDVSRFYGAYSGSAEVQASDGRVIPRDMSVEISESGGGFTVRWVSVTYKCPSVRFTCISVQGSI